MRRLLVLALTASMALMSSVALSSADTGKTVTLRGTEKFVANAFISADFRFSPGPLSVKSGDTVTWQNVIVASDPHSVSVVLANQLPASVDDVFQCGACAQFFQCHGFSMNGPPASLTCGNATNGELKAPGDSFLIPPPGVGPQTFSFRVTAAPGTVLHYMCIIHPWMQGEIDVS
jgi:plastocyanin